MSCNYIAGKSDVELYTEKSNELIIQIIEHRFSDKTCFVEPYDLNLIEEKKSSIPDFFSTRLKSDILNTLNYENDSIFEIAFNLSNSFTFDFSSLSDREINSIKRKEYEEIINQKGYGDALIYFSNDKCSKGVITFSKPIFNSNYSIW